MAHVFISYAHVDFEFAENLKHRLEKADFDVWMDEERLRAGEDWREEIDDAIREAFALILIISPTSMDSSYVMYEWSFAWGAGKKVIPLLYETVEDEKIHHRLDKRQYLNFLNRATRQWDELIQRLNYIKNELVSGNMKLQVNKQSFERVESDSRISGLIEDLNALNSTEDIRVGAINVLATLSELNDPRIAEEISKGLRSISWRVRIASVRATGKLKDAKSILRLLVLLNGDTDTDVRIAAARALGEIGDSLAVKGLASQLSNEDWGEITESHVCTEVANALEIIGTPEAIEIVQEWRNRSFPPDDKAYHDFAPPPDDEVGDIPF